MCTVIDADTFAYFCNKDSELYNDFQPVRDWIENSRCKIVYGGTKYGKHLRDNPRFRSYLAEHEHKGKIKRLCRAEVDSATSIIKGNFSGIDFNDHHIVALVLITRCKLVCSRDNGLKNLIDICYSSSGSTIIKSQLRIRNLRKPSIYRSRGSAATIRSRTSTDNCGPCCHT